MAYDSLMWGLLMFGCSIQALLAVSKDDPLEYMSKEEREALKEEARDMFYHAYNAYMDNAYPADELMPLSCKGRYRGSEPNRGDIDSTLGNFSLTLVDTLDTLVVSVPEHCFIYQVLGDLEEFENAVKLVARDVSFDTDVIVSLFETNIRMLGGLLSGHILAEYLQQRADIMPWYRGELLNLAKDLGYRFLPAFNTTTGIPYGRINLKHGMKGVPLEVSRETCTACAGSMILEMAALSRLTGEAIFEEKAQKAMDVLWRMRHRGTDLMGSVLNVHSGDWVRRDSGVGAGIDSYYEYCLKAYILLGDEKYLGRFNKHYQAVMKYVSQGPMLLDVHMHRPNTNSKNFMDALLAFWPGLQVLKGDIKPAVETHEMLYQVMQRHNFIPEAFTIDFQVHWGHHPLRPEFLESTYFLYRATGDHYYLGVGRKVLKSLQTYARVPCGYAAVSDVRTNKHDDTMDSFVLSETFKYLFLLFAEPGELVLDLDEFIFTTEGHLLPLTLASIRTNVSSDLERDIVHVDEMDRTCPNSLHLFPASVRQPLRNMVEDVCPRRAIKRRLSAAQFQANNLEHLKLLSDMGITTLTLADGRVQLLHTFSNAKTPQDSEEGLLFMQEMVEISKMQSQQAETKPQVVTFVRPNTNPPQKVRLLAGPAHFGLELQGLNKIIGKVGFTYPLAACTDLRNAHKLAGKIAILERGNCMFIEKARRIQQAGAIAGIVLDNVDGSSAATSPMFAMSGDGKELDDVTIPVVFLFSDEASELVQAHAAAHGDLTVTLGNFFPNEEVQLKAPTDLSMFERLKGSLKFFLTRQMTPQTSPSSGTNLDMVSEIKDEDVEKVIVVFDDLHAEIIKDPLGGEVRITSMYIPTRFTSKLEDNALVEKQWHQLKEVFVNQIYKDAKPNAGLQIRSFILQSYYNWVVRSRGRNDDVLKVSLRDKVLWFLEELAEIVPNPSIMKMGQLMDFNKQKLLKQYLLTRMDIMVLNMQTFTTMLKAMKSQSPNTEQFVKICKLNIAQAVAHYKFLRQLLPGIFDTEDESSIEHLILLDDVNRAVHKEYREMLVDGARENFEKLVVDKSSYYDIVIDNWQRELKLIEKLDILKRTKEHDSTIAEFMTDSNESSKTELKSKDVFNMPKRNEDMKVGKYEDFEYFILTEIEKAVKSSEQDTIRKYQEHTDITRDAADNTSKEIVNSNKVILNVSPQNQSKADTFTDTIKYHMKFLIKKKIVDFTNDIDPLGDRTKITNSLDNIQSNNIDYQETVTNNNSAEEQVYEESSSKGNDLQLIDAQMSSPSVNTKEKDEAEAVSQDVEKEDTDTKRNQKTRPSTEHSVNLNVDSNKIRPSDLPKEFHDQTRAFEKELSKHSVQVEEKTETSASIEESKSQDSEKHAIQAESTKVDVQEHGGKHIDDEL